ncbi:MAG: methylated-DNA--[protein]-cysteine S-methyltransferase [Propionibacteriaceae bacterium]|nr:methylated-DNA--[protein]-cysteine S-methyltransferase [Propionibacteriaceae bacterium]
MAPHTTATRVFCRTLPTPDGPFTILGDDTAVLASGWTSDPGFLTARMRGATGLALDHAAPVPTYFHEAMRAVDEYYGGDRQVVHQVPVRVESGPFHAQVRQVLHEIPYGRTVTYSQLAAAAGAPRAVRAAASACASNSTALFVPCHRVIRSDGSLGGFLYGIPLKERLLERERRATSEGPSRA